MELVICRIVQESLTHVHRHSGSKSASLRVAREADKIIVEVQDQGREMPPEKLVEIQSQGSGLGISGMRERLRHFSGELVVESNARAQRLSPLFCQRRFRWRSKSSSDRDAKSPDHPVNPPHMFESRVPVF
jgi:signal transduction histidine kinase